MTTLPFNKLNRILCFSWGENKFDEIQGSIKVCTQTERVQLKIIRDKKRNQESNAARGYYTCGESSAVNACYELIARLNRLQFDVDTPDNNGVLYHDDVASIQITTIISDPC